mmetsp:Transcript_16764/g.65484  ORF Transcript_16764/g.65484 Transcript_16764/m.65484 type:complete len:530 (+) Transcript_16764:16-1605(+)
MGSVHSRSSRVSEVVKSPCSEHLLLGGGLAPLGRNSRMGIRVDSGGAVHARHSADGNRLLHWLRRLLLLALGVGHRQLLLLLEERSHLPLLHENLLLQLLLLDLLRRKRRLRRRPVRGRVRSRLLTLRLSCQRPHEAERLTQGLPRCISDLAAALLLNNITDGHVDLGADGLDVGRQSLGAAGDSLVEEEARRQQCGEHSDIEQEESAEHGRHVGEADQHNHRLEREERQRLVTVCYERVHLLEHCPVDGAVGADDVLVGHQRLQCAPAVRLGHQLPDTRPRDAEVVQRRAAAHRRNQQVAGQLQQPHLREQHRRVPQHHVRHHARPRQHQRSLPEEHGGGKDDEVLVGGEAEGGLADVAREACVGSAGAGLLLGSARRLVSAALLLGRSGSRGLPRSHGGDRAAGALCRAALPRPRLRSLSLSLPQRHCGSGRALCLRLPLLRRRLLLLRQLGGQQLPLPLPCLALLLQQQLPLLLRQLRRLLLLLLLLLRRRPLLALHARPEIHSLSLCCLSLSLTRARALALSLED